MSRRSEDPMLASARREAWLVFAIWCLACAYTVGYCYLHGFGRDASTIEYVLGFPDWVFYGIVAPWTACTLTSFVLAYFVIQDEDLEDEGAHADLASVEDTLSRQER
jgi:Protein of unknown function (DUF997)